jgi:tricorn protease
VSRSANSSAGLIVGLLFALLASSAARAAEYGYYRYPTISGNQVVFVCEGDLWRVSTDGGPAVRLTSQAVLKYMPHFSPDGKWIAFSGNYDSNSNVYVIPADGGEPRRITFQPDANEVVGWTPDGSAVIYRVRRGGLDSEEYLYKAPVAGGQPTRLPLGTAAELSFSPDGKRIAFNRQGWGSNWRHYKGGTAPTIWIGDAGGGNFKQATKGPSVAMFPMWIGSRIYYVGDVAGPLNIVSMKPDGSDVRQLTHQADYEVRRPSTDGQQIVYSCGADLWVVDPKTGADRKIDIILPSDRAREFSRYEDASKALDSFDLSSDGKRITVAARGQAWATGAKTGGRIIKVADQPGVRNRSVTFSPDDEKIATITDETGEQELAIFDAKGVEPHKVLTHNNKGWLFAPTWSPDGKSIAYADLTLTLWIADATTGKLTQVDQSKNGEITEYAFSPDAKWLAYTVEDDNGFSQIRLYDVTAKKSYPMSAPFANDWSPSWDPNGKYLYFLSSRSFLPMGDDFENDFNIQRSAKPCLAILKKEGKSPFLPDEVLEGDDDDSDSADASAPDDTATTKEAESKADTKPATTKSTTTKSATMPATTQAGDKGKKKKKEKEKKELPKMTLDLEGIDQRVVEFPVPGDNYDGLRAADGRVFYMANGPRTIADPDGPQQHEESRLIAFDIKSKKPDDFATGISSYTISGDGKRIALHQDGVITVTDVTTKPTPDAEEKLEVGKLPLKVQVQAEWKQIFAEAWRLQRDFYWNASMNGVNWPATRARFEPLLSRVGTRGELNDLIGQMQAELGNSHEYIFGGDSGDFRAPSPPPVGVLGAEIEHDAKTGLFKFVRVYRPEAWETDIAAPLTASYVHVHDGDYLLAINGHTLTPTDSVDELLADQAGVLVQLSVCSKADKSDARDVLLTTLTSDEHLRYRDWCRRNREYVDQKSNGKLGYIHLPDMEGAGLVSFIKGFYAQANKDGLVIDERDNHGGFVSQMIVSRLARKIWAYDHPRRGREGTYPAVVAPGYKVVLINEFAGSDGDIFPDSFKTLKLGPLIGKRTWGGVVGIRMDKPFVDFGVSSQPEFAFWDPKRGWPVEGHGVDPDIEVDRGPQDYLDGKDPQLDRGIEELLKMAKAHPIYRPTPPPPPDRPAMNGETKGHH